MTAITREYLDARLADLAARATAAARRPATRQANDAWHDKDTPNAVLDLIAALRRVLDLTYASDDGSEWEHDEGCDGQSCCARCWADDILAALAGPPIYREGYLDALAANEDALAAVALAGESVERASFEVDRAKRALLASNVERDALAAENARLRAQVQAVEALHRNDDGTCPTCLVGTTPFPQPAPWPCNTARALATTEAGDVPMSSNRGHDLRERIAQRIDQAWAEAKDRDRSDGGYRDGYLDGLEHAEGIARSTSLTEAGEES